MITIKISEGVTKLVASKGKVIFDPFNNKKTKSLYVNEADIDCYIEEDEE